jgi:hypothetical protein
MPEMTATDALDLATPMRPQRIGTTSTKAIGDPLVEPSWSGVHVIAAAQGGRAVLLEEGEPVAGHDVIVSALATTIATTAEGVILDAYLTKQTASDQPGVFTGADITPSTTDFLPQSLVGKRRTRREELLREREAESTARTFLPEDIVALVAVDLLWLDGAWLLDVPLLERRRLLEAVVPGGELVRPGMYIRPPIDPWIGSWRAQGFGAVTFKAANSRYRPGETTSDWATAPIPRR